MNDAAARAAAPKNSRPSDKRKKRKLKKKKQASKEPLETPPQTLETSHDVNLAIEPDSPQATVPLSPRKQTLMRHRKSDAIIGEPLFISEVKELKKSRRPSPAPVDAAGYRKFSLDLSNQTVEDKATLFKCPAARIVMFHEQLEDSPARASSGTLLGHGEFEIFQLHNGDVTYLACGRLFVYPLLPKLKMLRIDKNQLILPLVNPQRYWKIHIDSDDMRVISELEVVLKKIVNYTNLSLPENGTYRSSIDSIAPNVDADQEKGSEEKHSEAVEKDSKEKGPLEGTSLEKDSEERISLEKESERTSIEKGSPATGHFTPFFNDIPELPPSAPVSPSNLTLFVQDNFQLLPVKQPLFTTAPQKPKQSITSSFNNFKMAPQQHNRKNGLLKNNQHQPERSIHANPYRQDGHDLSDHHSDLSSMDSLLDEYEENISTTKSINFNISRPQSRAISVASSSHPPAVHYQRGRIAVFPDRSINAGSHYGTVEQGEEEEDDFPTTSLSHYNKAHQNSRSARSRRSSRSELYSSVSNWMEPGPKNVLAHSRSNYSLASRHSNVRAANLNETYREIYRSITLNNLSLVANGMDKETSQNDTTSRGNATSKCQSGPYYSKLLVSEQGPRKRGELEGRQNKLDGFSSNEVYRLLSSRGQGPEKRSTIGRFFGW